MDKVCENCGKTYRALGKKQQAESEYCGRDCYWQVRGRAKVKICPECNKEFSNNEHSKAIYCSNMCRTTAQSKGKSIPSLSPIRTCAQCGKQFKKKGNQKNYYCTRECFHKSQKTGKTYKYRSQVYPKGWENLKKSALLRDLNTCQKCFKVCTKKGDASVHHIIDREHNELEDLITLCRVCHTKVTVVENALRILSAEGAEEYMPFVHELKDFIKNE